MEPQVGDCYVCHGQKFEVTKVEGDTVYFRRGAATGGPTQDVSLPLDQWASTVQHCQPCGA
jgi:hypothetical protein